MRYNFEKTKEKKQVGVKNIILILIIITLCAILATLFYYGKTGTDFASNIKVNVGMIYKKITQGELIGKENFYSFYIYDGVKNVISESTLNSNNYLLNDDKKLTPVSKDCICMYDIDFNHKVEYAASEQVNIDRYEIIQENEVLTTNRDIYVLGHDFYFDSIYDLKNYDIIYLYNNGVEHKYFVRLSELAAYDEEEEDYITESGFMYYFGYTDYESIRLSTCRGENARWIVIGEKIY